MLDATPGGATANSYGTLAEANAYFQTRAFAEAWTTLTDDARKTTALITVTERLERLAYTGERTSDAQALKFPRENCYTSDGERQASNVVPRRVKLAQFEYALALVGGSDPLASGDLAGFEEIHLPGGIKFKTSEAARSAGGTPSAVEELIAPFRTADGSLLLRG